MDHREQRDRAGSGSRTGQGRRANSLQLAAGRAVDDVPPAFAQARPEGIGSDKVALAPAFDAFGQEAFSFEPIHARPSGQLGHLPINGEEPRTYPFFFFLTAAVSAGTIFKASPTTPRSAIFMIGASASLLMAMITFDVFMPTVCCIAPEMPTAM
jgi:hypothetical protein